MNIRELATFMGQGRILPAIKFFEPKPKFLKWMKDTYGDKLIYDVGAGCGHVARALSAQGLEVVAIDTNYRERKESFPVEIADGEVYEYKPGSVVMFCRPCHGSFVGEVISQAVRCGASAILYVGLEKNFEGDLGAYLPKFEKALTEAGLEDEDVLEWKLKA